VVIDAASSDRAPSTGTHARLGGLIRARAGERKPAAATRTPRRQGEQRRRTSMPSARPLTGRNAPAFSMAADATILTAIVEPNGFPPRCKLWPFRRGLDEYAMRPATSG